MLRYILPAVVACLLFSSPALAQTGQAVDVFPSAQSSSAGGTITLAVGSDVAVGETVTTGPDGKVELIFTDGTKLVIGPASSLLIEAYLLRADGSGNMAIEALSGTFRFFSGSLARESYDISTPTGTIGIRGTIFELYVGPNGETVLTLLEGEVDLCPLTGPCESVQINPMEACAAALMISTDAMGNTGLSEAEFFDAFPYLASQADLTEPFRVGTVDDCAEQFEQIALEIVEGSPN